MAGGRTGGVSLGAVNERRLRPIYEHLDSGNSKGALHEAEKVLKKQKDLTAAKVLKTIALHRLGRQDEAFSFSQEIVALKPTDENSLQGLSLYYRETYRPDLIPTIYESAVSLCPGNEEYLTHLFMAYVRTERLKDMQRVALILYKHHPKNPYLFWGIMAIMMQAQRDEKLGKAMFLPLAERMIEKHKEKGKLEAEAEFRLYLTILRMLGKHEKCLEILEKEKAVRLSLDQNSFKEIEMGVFERMNKWEKVNQENKKLLKEDPSVWNYVVGYLDSLENLVESGWTPGEKESEPGTSSDDPDYKWEQGVEFIMNLVETEKNDVKRRRRGPFLAKLELYRRLNEKLKAPDTGCLEKLGSPVDILFEYVEWFSNKPCCFGDIQPYFKCLSDVETEQLLQKIKEEETAFLAEEISDGDIEEFNHKVQETKIQKHLFLLKMLRSLGQHDSMERTDRLELVASWLQRHAKGLKYSSYRPVTDVLAVDDYCLLAANVMLDLHNENGDAEDLWRAIYILEIGKQRSPSNFKFKFMLIRLYCTVGVFMPCAQIYDSLDIKHMQQDTLGYIVCHSVSALGHYQLASQAFEASRAYFLSNDKDSVEFLIACFRNGTFHKVSEFVAFRHRVKNSLHAALTNAEHTYMDLITQANIEIPYEELMRSCCMPKQKTDFDNLTDNRDFNVTFDWAPESRSLEQAHIEKTFRLEKQWVHFREIQVRAIIGLLNHARERHATDVTTNNVDVNALLEELEETYQESSKDPDLHVQLPFHGPPTPRIKPSMEVGYQETTVALLRLFQKFLNDYTSTEAKPEWKELSATVISKIEGALKDCLAEAPPVSGEVSKSTHVKKSATHDHEGCHGDCEHDSAGVTSSPEETVESALTLEVPENLKLLKRHKLERLVLVCESFSLSVLLLFNFKILVSEVKAEAMKRRRRKKGKQETLPAIVQFYQTFVHDLLRLGESIQEAVNHIQSWTEVMTLDLSKATIGNGEQLSNGEIAQDKSNGTETHTEGDTPTPTKATPLPDQLIKLSSESLLNAVNQLKDIVQGRIKNLKGIKI